MRKYEIKAEDDAPMGIKKVKNIRGKLYAFPGKNQEHRAILEGKKIGMIKKVNHDFNKILPIVKRKMQIKALGSVKQK